MSTGEHVAHQHEAFVAMTEALDGADWERGSWCQDWTVRDVVTHVAGHVHNEPHTLERLADLARSGFRPPRAAQRFVARHRDLSHDDLVAWLRRPLNVDAEGTNTAVQLAELTIHGADISRPLGIEQHTDPEILRLLLDHGLTRVGSLAVAGARRRAQGLRLEARDLGWTFGAGPLVSGPGDALLLALNGRRGALADLAGPGLDQLSARVS